MRRESSKNQQTQRQAQQQAQTWTAVIGAAAIGAAAMFLSDPDRGKRRRALIKDKMRSAAVQTSNSIDVASRDLGNRVQGLRAQSRRWLSRRSEAVDDQVVVARVRERLGRVVSHPHAVKVNALQGCVSLSGPILASEKEQLLSAVRAVQGVTELDDQLIAHERAEGVAALQGGRNRAQQGRSMIMQEHWPPALRAVAIVGGGVLSLFGLTRRHPAGVAAAALGVGLVARSVADRPFWRSSGAGAQSLDLHKTIYIEAAPEKVYDFWSRYENFPHFMSNVREVQDLGNGRSHWVVSGPAGIQVEWDSALTETRRPDMLAWQSEPGATVDHCGRITFEPANDGTRVTVDISYSPPAGAAGQAAASLFNGNPKRQLDEDLMRMKSFIESGVPPGDAAQPVQRAGEALH